MNAVKQLYELQQVDLEIQKAKQALQDISNQLQEPDALISARIQLATQKQHLEEAEKRQQELEWKIEDIQEKIRRVDKSLYENTAKNPRELLNMELELKSMKHILDKDESHLLNLMEQAEGMQDEIATSEEKTTSLEQEWQVKQHTLSTQKSVIESRLSGLEQQSKQMRQQTSPSTLKLYQEIKSAKGQAVVQVEQGKCQGCRVTLPLGEWQQVKAGKIVQCSNCGRILYLE